MKIAPYVSKLNDSPVFRGFQKEHNDAFMVAGFFVIDLETNNNVHQIDYYVPSKRKIAAFTLDKQITMQMLDLLNAKIPEKLDIKTNIDLDQLHVILEDEMKKRSITAEIKKIIAILQNIEGKKIWNLSCVLSGMGILNAHVEDSSRTVLKMEKKSLLDFIQKVNPQDLKMPNADATPGEKPDKKQVEEQIKKLNQLEEAIEKEKEELQKQDSNKEGSKKEKKIEEKDKSKGPKKPKKR